ncbi:MAG: DNA mismatch repair endonuclease MutL, partial [Candidatus Paceibacterota bacterium]
MALNRIKVLDDLTINQISAGEVVDRPVSVVRELVENALDAGATKIIVHINNGGRSLIRVADNGSGMSRDDALLAIERHATSKITKASDLTFIHSLGFRGEALPSIAAVSKVQIKTKLQADPTGTLLIIHGGKLLQVEDITCSNGTTIEVAKLFYNTPARKNFLKSNKTEELKIKYWLQSIAIANPALALQLYLDETLILNLPKDEILENRTKKVFPDSQIRINYQSGALNINGYLSPPSLSLSGSSGLMIIVNRRLVGDRLILRAIKEAFGIALKIKEFPKGFLILDLPPAEVDVNVHPQKAEVRFQNPQIVFENIQSAIQLALKSFSTPNNWLSASKPMELGTPNPWKDALYFNPSASQSENLNLNFKQTSEQSSSPYLAKKNHSLDDLKNNPVVNLAPFPKFSDLKYIGQALGCYLLCEHQEDLFIVDLHAAQHNRARAGQTQR